MCVSSHHNLLLKTFSWFSCYYRNIVFIEISNNGNNRNMATLYAIIEEGPGVTYIDEKLSASCIGHKPADL